jgi:Phospholipase_D-nuclease N-terminal
VDVAAGAGVGLIFILIMALSIGGLAFWVVALVDCIRRPEVVYRIAGTEKVTWVLIVALAGWIGGLIYWFSQRARLQEVERTGVAAFAPTWVTPYPGYTIGPTVTPPGWYPDRRAPGSDGGTASAGPSTSATARAADAGAFVRPADAPR